MVLNFGGQYLPPGWICLVCGAHDNQQELPHNFKKMAKDVYTPDVMEASDCMLVEEIYVARAPGRLDVVGGIVDYSGSLVL
ncbi:hypothetical protein Lser_V15G04532 [Lactuca serriola]